MKELTYQIRQETQTTQIPHTCLSRLCLLFSTNDGDERDVDEGKVFVADAELELTQRLNKGGRFNVTDGTAELDRQTHLPSCTTLKRS
jgi:hypothetical protein